MVAAHRSAAVRDVSSSKGTPSVVYRIAGENFIIIIPGEYRSGYMRTCAPPFLLRGTGQRMRPFTQRGIDVENVCAVPCRPVGRMWAKPSPEPFPAPASTASSEIRRLPHPAVEALDTPSPLFRRAPAEQARAQIARMDKASMGLRSWMELAPALERSLAYARSWNPDERAAEHSGIRITWGEVVASLEKLKAILPRLDAQPELLEEGFQWLSVAPEVKFTGYYSPVMQASRTRKPGYEYPIYRLPEELAPDLAWCLPTHSCPEDAFLQVIKPEDPYYSRADIDLDGALKSRNLEMAWLEHPVETYDLMLEGSGILAFDDGTQQAALFAGLNGHSGQSMAGYLIRSGELPRNKASMKGIRQWWDNHPQKRRAFLNASSGYVFFRFGAEHPKGTAGCELTPWVSMAVDPRVLPLGGIVSYALPGQRQGIRRGLGFAHDTGGAIRLRRIDMYTGEGEDAHRQAMTIYNQGQVWLLLAKQ